MTETEIKAVVGKFAEVAVLLLTPTPTTRQRSSVSLDSS
jgi:hypothetical protein